MLVVYAMTDFDTHRGATHRPVFRSGTNTGLWGHVSITVCITLCNKWKWNNSKYMHLLYFITLREILATNNAKLLSFIWGSFMINGSCLQFRVFNKGRNVHSSTNFSVFIRNVIFSKSWKAIPVVKSCYWTNCSFYAGQSCCLKCFVCQVNVGIRTKCHKHVTLQIKSWKSAIKSETTFSCLSVGCECFTLFSGSIVACPERTLST